MAENTGALLATLGFLFRRTVVEYLGLFAFLAAIALSVRLLLDSVQTGYAWSLVVLLVMLPRMGAAFSRMMTAPRRPDVRLMNLNDADAKWLHRQQIVLLFLLGLSVYLPQFNRMNDIEVGTGSIGFWLNAIVHFHVACLAWSGHAALTEMARGKGDDVSDLDEAVSRACPYFCIVVAIGTWMLFNIATSFERLDVLASAPHYVTMFLLVMIPALDTALRGLVRHIVPPMRGEGVVARDAYLATKRSYVRMGRVIVLVGMLLVLTRVWQIDLRDIADAGVGATMARRFIEVMMTVSVGYLIFELVSLLINRKLAAEQTALGTDLQEEEPGGGEGGGTGGSRLSTVLPLIRLTSRVAVVVMFPLLALGQLGVDTTQVLVSLVWPSVLARKSW